MQNDDLTQDPVFMQHLTAANRAAGWPDPTEEEVRAARQASKQLAEILGSHLDESHCDPHISEHPLAGALNKAAELAWDEHRKRHARNGSDFNPIGRTPVVRGFDFYPKPDIDNPWDMMSTPFFIVAAKPIKAFPLQELDDFLHGPYPDSGHLFTNLEPKCDIRLSANCNDDGWLRVALKGGQFVTAHQVCSPCRDWFVNWWYPDPDETNPTNVARHAELSKLIDGGA